jgi:hypothetical protein
MKYSLILAAAAFLAVGCHNRSQDETGAAPNKGEAAVTATDTASVQTDSTTAALPEATPDTTSAAAPDASVPASDSPAAVTDSTAAAVPADTTAQQ